jgi:hypothetical protein
MKKEEYRKVVEDFIGRKLTSSEVVHHIDCNRNNNSINNLMIFPNQKEHAKFHVKMKRFGYFTNPMRMQIATRWKPYKCKTTIN